MLRNNNMAVVERMAKRSLKSNKRRSITMILAVVLSAFLLFSFLTVGATYFKMQRVQNIRLNGNESDAIMYGGTEEQLETARKNPDIEKIGIFAVSGYVKETPKDKTPNANLVWVDHVYWDEMAVPARKWMKGEYPQEADEVVATETALQECGYEGLGVGDTFVMTCETAAGCEEKTFRISGMWEGYATQKTFLVSEAFYKKSGYTLADVSSGRVFFQFKQRLMSQSAQDAFIERMELGKQQRIFFMFEMGRSIQILFGIIALILITCLCAYLLIYNIMYLSVAGNIRHYGLLQTIGMTERQIYRMMRRQTLLIGGIGIGGGLLAGSVISFFLIPFVVKSLGIYTKQAGKILISFHPAIFFATILFTGLTVWIASRKPAKMAVCCSPIEALGYRPNAGAKKSHKTGRGKLLWRMAKEQLGKDKKKSAIIMLSLGVSLSVFVCMITLFRSQGAREYSYNYMDLDMVLKNDTINIEELDKHQPIIDEKLLSDIEKTEGVTEVHPVVYTEITVPWEPEFSDKWMREFYEMWMSIPYEDDIEEYKAHPENFASCLVGISEADFDYLNGEMETPVDKEAFLSGKTCILSRNDLDFQNSDLAGKEVTCTKYEDLESRITFEIAGLTDERYYNALNACPPIIIVSDKVVKEFVRDPIVFKAGIRYEEEYDKATEEAILELLETNVHAKDFSYDSKIELMENVRKAQGNMRAVGIGIIAILTFIGLMNYVNTTIGNIQSRQVEISVMESIGMTGKQVRKMLVIEGMLYAGGAWVLVVTLGLAVTYQVYQSLNYNGVAFAIPLVPVIAAMLCIGLVCAVIPMVVYRGLEKKGSVVERIKEFE